MTYRERILAKLKGSDDPRPIFLPDLTLWYEFHEKNGTLPAPWSNLTLSEVARDLGVPIWTYSATERILSPQVNVVTTENSGERVITAETSAGILTARWIVGPDGAMWQTEYPVKEAADLDAVLELAAARSYVINPDHDRLMAEVGNDGIVAIEIPRRPLSDLLHEYLGWDEGLMLFFEAGDKISEIVGILEETLQTFVQSLAHVPGELAYSLDNLDGQFISPKLYQGHMAASYRRTSELLHAHSKQFMVHIGGPIRHLAKPLADAGIDALEGIAGPPQGDLLPVDMRELVGPDCVLWGGIAQDFLLNTHAEKDFIDAVQEAVQAAQNDSRFIIGVADRVPVDADLTRLEALSAMIENGY